MTYGFDPPKFKINQKIQKKSHKLGFQLIFNEKTKFKVIADFSCLATVVLLFHEECPHCAVVGCFENSLEKWANCQSYILAHVPLKSTF